jgi:peroxiredoxin
VACIYKAVITGLSRESGAKVKDGEPARTRSKLDIAVNIAILLVAGLLATVLVKQLLLGKRSESYESVRVGEKLRVSNINQSQNKTLVLALSTNCHFCSESAPFYRNLLNRLEERGVGVVALFPQPRAEAAEYLKKLDLPIANVQQADFRDIPVAGTPTLILVDQRSVVTNVWVGKLMSEEEGEVLSKL